MVKRLPRRPASEWASDACLLLGGALVVGAVWHLWPIGAVLLVGFVLLAFGVALKGPGGRT